MEIFKLFGNIFVDNEKANDSISKTDKKGQSLAGTFGKMGKSALAVGKVMAVGFAAGGAAAVALAVKTGETADRLLDLSSITGLSTDELQKWERVSTVAGVSADAMSNVSNKLTKQMDILSTGTGKSAEALEKLGINYDEFAELSSDERLNLVASRLGGVEDATERARLGTDLLGGSWKELAPILDVGAEELQNIKDNANIINEDDLNRANEFRINVDTMKESIGVFGQELAIKFIPLLNKLFDWFKENGPLIGEIFDKSMMVISKAIEIVVDWVKVNLIPVFESMYQWVQDNMPLLQSIWEEVFNTIKLVVETLIDVFDRLFMPILNFIFDWVQKNMPQIKDIFEFIFKFIQGIIEVTTIVISGMVDGLIYAFNYIKGTFQSVGTYFKSAFNGVVDFVQNIINKVDRFIQKVTDAVSALKTFVGLDSDSAEKRKNSGPTTSNLSSFVPLDGSNKNGLDYVPFDGYVSELHKGEKVLTSEEAKDYRSGNGIQNTFNINGAIIREENDIRKIAKELYNMQKTNGRGLGFV